MKAILCTKYGPPEVLKLIEIEKPAPGDGDVLIKIYASTVTMGDCELRSLTLPLWTRLPMRLLMGYRKPRRFIPGMEFSGVIEAVGEKVSLFKKGDAVFGSSGFHMSANAEYKSQRVNSAIAVKPLNVSFEAAATLPVGGLNALHFLRKAAIKPGQKVLIIGAGGSIGTYGVQLAKLYGAEVTAVDDTNKLDMLRSIGADCVIDYTKEDYSKNGVKYDVIFDMIYKSSFSKCVSALKEDGCYLMANTGPRRMLWSLWVSWTSRKKMIFALAGEKVEDLNHLAGLIASNKMKPVIDRIFPLEKIADAHSYVEKGYKKGNVVIRVSHEQ
ncbi:MAG TPA: NAD(P)-dependent alcohol dehydrogenase [Cyclobacteriaceae bacterium]|nr:NAD(P)-dependent alcohol dehydrogenase [Cyclobacteriaceae bacterium]